MVLLSEDTRKGELRFFRSSHMDHKPFQGPFSHLVIKVRSINPNTWSKLTPKPTPKNKELARLAHTPGLIFCLSLIQAHRSVSRLVRLQKVHTPGSLKGEVEGKGAPASGTSRERWTVLGSPYLPWTALP